MVNDRKGLSGVEGGKGICHLWKEKGQYSKANQCSFRHESNDRAQMPEHTAAEPSEPSFSRGRSVSRNRRIKGKNNPGIILRQPCRYYLKGISTKLHCEYWHPPTKQKRDAKPWISVCSRIIRLMNNRTKNPRKAAVHQKEEKATTRMLAVVKIVPQLGRVSQDSEFLDSQRGRQARGNPMKKSWDRFEEYDSLSLRYVKQVSGKRKERRLENTSRSSSSAKSLRYEI